MTLRETLTEHYFVYPENRTDGFLVTVDTHVTHDYDREVKPGEVIQVIYCGNHVATWTIGESK